ncbi:MAG: membrane protein insertase YidC [Alphaproteobacteria bacterium]|nr:membrane protein insertase YidC [Alphaproteobacteria bacterium]
MNDQKNLVFFVIIFISVMAGWHFFYDAPKIEKELATSAATTQTVNTPSSSPQLPVVTVDRSQALNSSTRVSIETPSLKGSINLKGASFDDLSLEKYKETTQDNSPNIVLLTPEQTKEPYFIQLGWTSADPNMQVPNAETIWTADRSTLTHQSEPVTLTWKNPQGVIFERKISVDENYVFTIEQNVINHSANPIQLAPFGQVSRVETPVTQGYYILHEGPIGFIENQLVEKKYTDLKENPETKITSQGGWIGFTDKYWLTALIPDQKTKSSFYFKDNKSSPRDHYETGFVGDVIQIAPGQTGSAKSHFFSGAKVLDLLDDYEAKLGVNHLDKAVDFGWFYFITKPLFILLTIIYKYIGNFGLAILLLTVMIKAVFFPLANKSYRSMARMKDLQPKIEKLKERFNDDKMRLNQEMMELYKKEGVNPAAGCLPILIQIPVFFALYKVFFVTIEMRHAPFYGWIHDLSAPDPTTIFNLFGLLPWSPPAVLMIGILPILMGVSMWIQQRLNPTPMDPIQQKMFMVMPVMLTYLLSQFPAGLVIYWTWNNILSIGQQWLIMKSSQKMVKAKS